MIPTKLRISVNRERDGSISICCSLKETEEQEVAELEEAHGGDATLLKFVMVSTKYQDDANTINALVTLLTTNDGEPGSLGSVFDELLKVVFEIGRQFPK